MVHPERLDLDSVGGVPVLYPWFATQRRQQAALTGRALTDEDQLALMDPLAVGQQQPQELQQRIRPVLCRRQHLGRERVVLDTEASQLRQLAKEQRQLKDSVPADIEVAHGP